MIVRLIEIGFILLGVYAYYKLISKFWKNADIDTKIENTLHTEEQYDKLKQFSKEHKNVQEKEEFVRQFTK